MDENKVMTASGDRNYGSIAYHDNGDDINLYVQADYQDYAVTYIYMYNDKVIQIF